MLSLLPELIDGNARNHRASSRVKLRTGVCRLGPMTQQMAVGWEALAVGLDYPRLHGYCLSAEVRGCQVPDGCRLLVG